MLHRTEFYLFSCTPWHFFLFLFSGNVLPQHKRSAASTVTHLLDFPLMSWWRARHLLFSYQKIVFNGFISLVLYFKKLDSMPLIFPLFCRYRQCTVTEVCYWCINYLLLNYSFCRGSFPMRLGEGCVTKLGKNNISVQKNESTWILKKNRTLLLGSLPAWKQRQVYIILRLCTYKCNKGM